MDDGWITSVDAAVVRTVRKVEEGVFGLLGAHGLLHPGLRFLRVEVGRVFAGLGVVGLKILVQVERVRPAVCVVVLRRVPVAVEVVKSAARRGVVPGRHARVPCD